MIRFSCICIPPASWWLKSAAQAIGPQRNSTPIRVSRTATFQEVGIFTTGRIRVQLADTLDGQRGGNGLGVSANLAFRKPLRVRQTAFRVAAFDHAKSNCRCAKAAERNRIRALLPHQRG